MNQRTETIKRLINIARHLHKTGRSGASTGEQIAAAFILNKPEYLPDNYSDMVEAWERLDNWQAYVKVIKQDYMYLIIED